MGVNEHLFTPLSAFVGKSLSDDLTGVAPLRPQPRPAPRVASRDSSTQSDEAPPGPEPTAESGKLKRSEATPAAATGGFIVIFKRFTPNSLLVC